MLVVRRILLVVVVRILLLIIVYSAVRPLAATGSAGNHYLATSINCDTYMSVASNSEREQEQQELERDEDGDEDEPPMRTTSMLG
jgi:hypothetical protein